MKDFFKIRSKKANRARIQVITIAVSLMLVAAIAIGGTVAWLVDTTESVTNTFTFGDINITLTETKATDSTVLDADTTAQANTYEGLVPGQVRAKNPTVTVKANSVPCYLFVKITENNNVIGSDKIIKWDINTDKGWTALGSSTNVYYVTVNKTTADVSFPVLKDNQVTVNSDVTKTMINSLNDSTYPTLAFTAYAIQSENLTDQNGDSSVDAADAWALINS